jgi:hypothetical protein
MYRQTPWGMVWIGPGLEPEKVNYLPKPKEEPVYWVPTFEKKFVKPLVTSWGGEYQINDMFLATSETAHEVMVRFSGLAVVERPFITPGGMWTTDAVERLVLFKDNILVNAGILADYFRRNPEKDFPGVAYNLANQLIQLTFKEVGKL